MIRKIFFITVVFISQLILTNFTFSSVKIIVSVNDEIITTYDVSKELNYLKILNPQLENLENSQLFEIAKQSLIRELIKKKEITKFIDLNKNDEIAKNYIKTLYSKLGYKNEDELINKIKDMKTYTIDEIKLKGKIEIFWNDLIINKYKDRIKVNNKKLETMLDNLSNEESKEFLLSEIVFRKRNNENLESLTEEIKNSIIKNGFSNSANIYSISESSKYGGKIGWIDQSTLSNKILEKISILKPNEISDVIKIDNLNIILKVNDVRIVKKNIDKKKELQKMVMIEKNKKLENYSMIHFNKIKSEYSINEK